MEIVDGDAKKKADVMIESEIVQEAGSSVAIVTEGKKKKTKLMRNGGD